MPRRRVTDYVLQLVQAGAVNITPDGFRAIGAES